MKAIDIVNYMVDYDLGKEELENLALRLIEHVSDNDLLEEIRKRM